MQLKKLEKINVKSVLKISACVYPVLGLLIGIFSFIWLKISPTAVPMRIGIWAWILSILIYTLVFSIIFVGISVVGSILYNFFSPRVGGVEISLEDNQPTQSAI